MCTRGFGFWIMALLIKSNLAKKKKSNFTAMRGPENLLPVPNPKACPILERNRSYIWTRDLMINGPSGQFHNQIRLVFNALVN